MTIPELCARIAAGYQDELTAFDDDMTWLLVELTAPDNLRRIVACVNACQGLSTEALENYYQELNVRTNQSETVKS